MAITEAFSGTEAVSTTEHSMTTDISGVAIETDDGVYQLFVTLFDMVVGDELQIRVYEKVGSGSTQRIVYQTNLTSDNSVSGQIIAFPALMLLHGWDMTLDAIAGTITVSWSIRKVA